VRRTVHNQYDSIVRPVSTWLAHQGVHFVIGTQVCDVQLVDEHGKVRVTALNLKTGDHIDPVGADDLVFLQNGSMTDATSLGSMTSAPPHLTKADSAGWVLWENIAKGRRDFGNPAAFNSSIPEAYWESFTVTCRTPTFFDQMEAFSGNVAGTGGLVTSGTPTGFSQ
jgi:oleate hydratase